MLPLVSLRVKGDIALSMDDEHRTHLDRQTHTACPMIYVAVIEATIVANIGIGTVNTAELMRMG